MLKRRFLVAVIFFSSIVFNGCSNASYGTRAGVNVTWGPNGPKVRPHIDFDVFNGGRL